jgi:hypothetical protein
MVTVPAATPPIAPVPLPAVATAVLLLLQLPPAVASLSVMVSPAHTAVLPVIANGKGKTVNGDAAIQPVGNVYVIFVVPAVIAYTVPDEEAMVAIAVLLLLHVPPAVASDRLVVVPAHIPEGPVIIEGSGLTVTVTMAMQPVANE